MRLANRRFLRALSGLGAAWGLRHFGQGLLSGLLASCLAGAPSVLADGTPVLGLSTQLLVKHRFVIDIPDKPKFTRKVTRALTEERATNERYARAKRLTTAQKYDRDWLNRYLRSLGYYAAQIDSRIEGDRLLYTLKPGPKYRLSRLDFDWPDGVARPPADQLALKVTDPLVATSVLKTLDTLRVWIENTQCLVQVRLDYEAWLYHESASARVVFRLAPSPQATFGDIRFSGDSEVRSDYLARFIPFKPGDCFNPKRLEQARLQLLQTNLLSRVEPVLLPAEEVKDAQALDSLPWPSATPKARTRPLASPVERPQAHLPAGGLALSQVPKSIPIELQLSDRKHRSWLGSLGYDADEKMRYSLGWQHRNLWHRGEQLTLGLYTSQLSRGLDSALVLPYFLNDAQKMTLDSRLATETQTAYQVHLGQIGAQVTRTLSPHWSVHGGLRLGFSRVAVLGSDDDYALLSSPWGFDYDRRNDLLNPTQGLALGVQWAPFTDLYQTGRKFYRTQGVASAYHTFDKSRFTPTLAARLAVGSLRGAPLNTIPADQRFYTGGGGSVRGYAYQSVGQVESGLPLGGLSFSTLSFEVRSRLTQTLGLTVFVDGGTNYAQSNPRFGDDYAWGAGLGLRYHTSFAPFRFDVATPLSRREQDDAIQVYLSVGQAF
jgi:translocation and assembly module TamA